MIHSEVIILTILKNPHERKNLRLKFENKVDS